MSAGRQSTTESFESTGRILVVDDHARARESMADILTGAGHDVVSCSSAVEALKICDKRSFDVIITDLKMPGMTGLEFIRALEQRGNEAQIAMVTAHATVHSAVEAMRHGAFDYIEKPFDADELEQLVRRAMRQVGAAGRRSEMPCAEDAECAMIGSSSAMQTLRKRIAQASPTDETILISGESGTGKELVARAIHAASRRANGALVSLNCPALSPQLMESELFGHERGAFTSADAPRVGRFELAESGTILLDEVSEIELPLQAKLLRVLQEKSYERVGSSETRRANVRVLATTNRDLQQEVIEGRFRQDLYFRLAVVPLHVPPLRERREDVLELAGHFLALAAARLNQDPCELDRAASDLLLSYRWPGNVREIENLMTRVTVLNPSRRVSVDQVTPWLIENDDVGGYGDESGNSNCKAGTSLQEMERTLIEQTLDEFRGHREKTAKALGIGVRTLANKLRSYGYGPRAKSFGEQALVETA